MVPEHVEGDRTPHPKPIKLLSHASLLHHPCNQLDAHRRRFVSVQKRRLGFINEKQYLCSDKITNILKLQSYGTRQRQALREDLFHVEVRR